MSVGMVGLIDAAGRYRVVARRAVRRVRPTPRARRDARLAAQSRLGAAIGAQAAPRRGRRDRRGCATSCSASRPKPRLRRRWACSEPAYDQMLDQIRVGRGRHGPAARSSAPAIRRCSTSRSTPTRARTFVSSAPRFATHLAQAITELPERERQILALYYQEELTLAEIGAVIGVGESRVSQLRTQAVGASAHAAARDAAAGGDAMSKILSQEEIDALMSTAASDASRHAAGQRPAAGGVITYNFRRPDRVSKEQIRSLHFLHDRFARNVTTSLAAYLRALDRVLDRVGRAVLVLRVPDVAVGPDRVLRHLDAAARRHCRARDQPDDRVHDRRPDARRLRPRHAAAARADRDRAERHRLGGQADSREPHRDLAGGVRSASSAFRRARPGRRCCRSPDPTKSSS